MTREKLCPRNSRVLQADEGFCSLRGLTLEQLEAMVPLLVELLRCDLPLLVSPRH